MAYKNKTSLEDAENLTVVAELSVLPLLAVECAPEWLNPWADLDPNMTVQCCVQQFNCTLLREGLIIFFGHIQPSLGGCVQQIW